MDIMDIFERTRLTAIRQGMNLRTLAERAELSPNSIYNWRRSNPKSENVEKVAKVLNVSVDYLLGNTEEPNGHAGEDDKDLEEMLKSTVSFDGKPLTDHDKRIILSMLKSLKAEGEL